MFAGAAGGYLILLTVSLYLPWQSGGRGGDGGGGTGGGAGAGARGGGRGR